VCSPFGFVIIIIHYAALLARGKAKKVLKFQKNLKTTPIYDIIFMVKYYLHLSKIGGKYGDN
jgi:hypothetical protein